MNRYSLTVFLSMVPREKKQTMPMQFFLGGGGGGGKQGLLWEMRKWRISFNIMRIEDWKI